MSAADPSPTRVRYSVLGFACSLSMITYLDRVCFGTAAGAIQEDLGLTSEADMKMAFTAFAFAYAAFEIPSGWLGDVFGPRRTLIRIVLWWSAFTMLTGCVTQDGLLFLGGMSGVTVLVVIRFLFGVGEAGAYPNLTRALHNWYPASERGSAQGAVWMAGRFMGGMTPLVWLLVVGYFKLSWRTAFFLFGALGLVWCVAFYWWFRDRPQQHPLVNPQEIALIEAGRTDEGQAHANVPWLKLFTSANLWYLCLMYFCAAYGWYFNITYLPQFLELQYRVDPNSTVGAIYKGGPLLFGAVTCLIGGILSDRFIRRTGNRKWGRRLFGVIGHTLCACCYLLCLITPTAFWFALAISMAAFWNDLTMGAAWATCQDIGKRYAAIVAGCMNTIGNLGGAAAGWITGTILGAYFSAGVADIGVAEKDQTDSAALVAAEINHAAKDEERLRELAENTDSTPESLVELVPLLPSIGAPKLTKRALEPIAEDLGWTMPELKVARDLRDKVAREQRSRVLYEAYRVNFLMFAAVYGLAVLFLLRVDATKPVDPGTSEKAEAHG
jgi:MFS transporter, ACS family, glucarate transporter